MNFRRVNFKKLIPQAPSIRESKVFEELQKIATEDPPRVQELKHSTTFLQKPDRPIPEGGRPKERAPPGLESYKVIIKKQQKKSVNEKLVEKGLLQPDDVIALEEEAKVKILKFSIDLH